MKQWRFLFLTIVLACCHTAYGQSSHDTVDEPAEIKKNSIHAIVGFAGVAGSCSINYERMLVAFEKGTLVGLWSKVGVGVAGVWSSGGPYQSVTLGVLTGAKNNHFELNIGGARMVNNIGYEDAQRMSAYFAEPPPSKSDFVDFKVAGTVGYRYQKPQGKLLFRCGIGFPETIFVGLGVAF